jgi:hypothetical protein
MKSRSTLLDRKPAAESAPEPPGPPVAITSAPMAADCDDECPFCHGPETD